MSDWHRQSCSDTDDIYPKGTDRTLRLVLAEQRAQHLRSSMFGGLRVRNPLWDMLLALFVAERANSQLSMSDLCSACDAPESTALRLIHQLRDKGYAEMIADRTDRRRTRVALTTKARAQFETYFQQTQNIG